MAVKTYFEAVEYLYQNLPMFQRVGSIAYKADLSNTIRLCEILGNPQESFRSIHVGGTNGKGSTSHMLASVLQSSGHKTGLYTSPHLKEFTERIRVNGEEVSQHFIVDFVNRMNEAIAEIKPSFFEITVAMAFEYFAQQKVDVAVIEVGLGGRLDSTNVITPVVSVITNIGWDHKEILGDTLTKIASEKAGIIKHHVPVVISERQQAVEEVFITKAEKSGSPLMFASDRFQVQASEGAAHLSCALLKENSDFLPHVLLPLPGLYQKRNLPGVLATLEVLQEKGFVISPDNIRHGLEHVISQTKLKGRWQKLRDRPAVICDTGHNVDGIREIVGQLGKQVYSKLHIVLGMVRDKDIDDILRILPHDATYYFCSARIPRALDAAALAERASAMGLSGMVIPDVNEALQTALKKAGSDDLVFVGGSTFVVAEIEGL